MSLEAATYISQLVAANPAAGDNASQGDDHLRLVKAALQATFPNASRAFRFFATDTEVAGDVTTDTDDMHKVIPVNATAAARTVTLGAVTIDGWWAIVTKYDSSSNAVTIDPSGATTINGASSITITNQYESVLCWWDNDEAMWRGMRFFPTKPYYSGGQDIPFSDIAPSANAKRVLAATTATDWSEHTIAAILEFISTSLARGDLLVRGASFFDRLAIGGSSGNPAFLTANGTDPSWNNPSGLVVGRAYDENNTYNDSGLTVPADDSIPQVSEGLEILSASITAKHADNVIRIEVNVTAAMSNGAATSCIHLHKDGAANAVAACFINHSISGEADGRNHPHVHHLVHEEVAGDTSAHTWSVLAGASAGNIRINGGTARIGGGVMKSTLAITEFSA